MPTNGGVNAVRLLAVIVRLPKSAYWNPTLPHSRFHLTSAS
jgi:hypothetical protein